MSVYVIYHYQGTVIYNDVRDIKHNENVHVPVYSLQVVGLH